MHPLRCCFGLPAVGTGAQDMGKFLAAFKRMGLSQRGAVALVGAHPFGRWAATYARTQQPACMNTRIIYLFMCKYTHLGGGLLPSLLRSCGPSRACPRLMQNSTGAWQAILFCASSIKTWRHAHTVLHLSYTFREILEDQDPLAKYLTQDPDCVAIMKEYILNPNAWAVEYAAAFQQLRWELCLWDIGRGEMGGGRGEPECAWHE